nr:tetratricopeptide repeat-containing sensor histidine kinase [Thermoflexibacter sp.]
TQSLRLATLAKDSLGMADAYRLLGMIHSFSLNQHETALTYHRLALPTYERSKDKKRIVALYNNFVWVFYMTKQEIPLAHQYADKALNLVRAINDHQLMSWTLNSKALIYSRENHYDSAIYYFNQSNEFAKKVNDEAVIAYNQILLGQVFLNQNSYEEAINTFNNSMPTIKKVNLKGLLSSAFQGLAAAYSGQKKYDSAFWYYEKHIHLRDSLLNWETSQKVTIIQAEYEEEMKQSKIESLEQEKRNYISIFSIIFIALLVVLALIIRSNQQKKLANILLKTKNGEIARQNEELAQTQEEITAQRDIVAEKNKELQELNQTKDKLFAIIGHDLRSPINSLKALLNLLVNRQMTVEEFFMFSEKLKRGAEHVHFTLNNLLQWAYSQMNGLTSNPQIVNLHQIGQENINLCMQTTLDKHINFDNQIPPDLTVFVDIDHLSLIFRNLISNAIKFTHTGGRVTITSQIISPTTCEIMISDTGIGISEEDISKIFRKDKHLSTQGTDGEKGTGLGLLLCQEMIEKNGGKIWVESTLEVGTSFKFTLPMK